jgi:hypothetical protein
VDEVLWRCVARLLLRGALGGDRRRFREVQTRLCSFRTVADGRERVDKADLVLVRDVNGLAEVQNHPWDDWVMCTHKGRMMEVEGLESEQKGAMIIASLGGSLVSDGRCAESRPSLPAMQSKVLTGRLSEKQGRQRAWRLPSSERPLQYHLQPDSFTDQQTENHQVCTCWHPRGKISPGVWSR